MNEVKITTDFIKLDSFLKLASAVSTGGHAKMVITGGEVKVNGQVCLMRGKKLYKDDTIEFEGIVYKVTV
ncbi:MAG: RNA-binding S4 domain-containing protein [Clostridia bacterium]|nr:RNA-binding S4 domain-containing protein [Clostridia bacterium]